MANINAVNRARRGRACAAAGIASRCGACKPARATCSWACTLQGVRVPGACARSASARDSLKDEQRAVVLKRERDACDRRGDEASKDEAHLRNRRADTRAREGLRSQPRGRTALRRALRRLNSARSALSAGEGTRGACGHNRARDAACTRAHEQCLVPKTELLQYEEHSANGREEGARNRSARAAASKVDPRAPATVQLGRAPKDRSGGNFESKRADDRACARNELRLARARTARPHKAARTTRRAHRSVHASTPIRACAARRACACGAVGPRRNRGCA